VRATGLRPTQRMLLRLVLRGLDKQEISVRLGSSPRTLDTRMSAIGRALLPERISRHPGNLRAHLIVLGVAAGWLTPDGAGGVRVQFPEDLL
jgi:DNA-binding NarL/FixJ family response regulator